MNKYTFTMKDRAVLHYRGHSISHEGRFTVISKRINPREKSYTNGWLFKEVVKYTSYDWVEIVAINNDEIRRVEIEESKDASNT